MQIIGEPIGAVEVKVNIRTSSVDNLVHRVLSYLSIRSEREGRVEENLENEPGCSVECDT